MSKLRTLAVGVGGAIVGIVMLRGVERRREEPTEDPERSAEEHARLAAEHAKAAGQKAVKAAREEPADKRAGGAGLTASRTEDKSRLRRVGKGWIRR